MRKVLMFLVLAVLLAALPMRSEASVWHGMWMIHHMHHTHGPASMFSKNTGFEVGPYAFVGGVFTAAFIIGHDHWLGCKDAYAVGTAQRATCQAEWNWPQGLFAKLPGGANYSGPALP